MPVILTPERDASLAPPQRASGVGRLTVRMAGGRSTPGRLYQEGSARLLLPRVRTDALEAVMINTAGGMTGGDRLSWTVQVGPGAAATVASQACEKIYRADSGEARVAVRLEIDDGGRLDWLPQETILFDHSAVRRSIEADVASSGRLLLAEAVVLGRLAMGETVRRATFHDRWRVRRDGRLVFADDIRLAGPIAEMTARRPVLGGVRAFATVLLVSPDAEGRLPAVRKALGAAGGASAFDGKLVVRVVAGEGLALRRALVPTLAALGCEPPRIWRL